MGAPCIRLGTWRSSTQATGSNALPRGRMSNMAWRASATESRCVGGTPVAASASHSMRAWGSSGMATSFSQFLPFGESQTQLIQPHSEQQDEAARHVLVAARYIQECEAIIECA